jgi:hypothetical protein
LELEDVGVNFFGLSDELNQKLQLNFDDDLFEEVRKLIKKELIKCALALVEGMAL